MSHEWHLTFETFDEWTERPRIRVPQKNYNGANDTVETGTEITQSVSEYLLFTF